MEMYGTTDNSILWMQWLTTMTETTTIATSQPPIFLKETTASHKQRIAIKQRYYD